MTEMTFYSGFRSGTNSLLVFFLAFTSALCVAETGDVVPAQQTEKPEEFYSAGHPSDRIESFNRAIFKFNDQADKYLLKPVAKTYQFLAPGFVDKGVTNFFNNLDDIETFVNSLFQFKFHNAIVTLNRVIYNTTFGLAGFFDVATVFGLKNDEEDFGQTLGYWGYEESTYLVLPFLGPSTVRDFSGRVVDSFLDPFAYNDEIHRDAHLMAKGVKLIDLRADLLAAENLQLSQDRYAFFRNAFLQNREYLIKDGVVADPFADDDINYEDF